MESSNGLTTDMGIDRGSAFFVHVEGSVSEIAMKVVQNQEEDNAFYVCDLFELKRRVQLWRQTLPRAVPYYAIKACTDPVIIRTLALDGVNFDCSNKKEIEAVINAGVHPSRIIYANTAKQRSHIEFAKEIGVTLMTFDCVQELEKITDKNARLLLRFAATEGHGKEVMARKFGCRISEAEDILRSATELGHNVVGVAYHIGSRIFNTGTVEQAVKHARELFDIGAKLGIRMSVLDLGGGFPGGVRKEKIFVKVGEALRAAVDLHFPESSGTQIIAEPGQFMVTATYTMAVQVVAKRTQQVAVDGMLQPHHDVYVNNSRQNTVPRELYPFMDIKYTLLTPPYDRQQNHLTTLWGATCHPLDSLEEIRPFMELHVGDWLLLDNVGGYGLVQACGFNGTGFTPVHYRTSAEDASRVLKIIENSPFLPGYGQPLDAIKKSWLPPPVHYMCS